MGDDHRHQQYRGNVSMSSTISTTTEDESSDAVANSTRYLSHISNSDVTNNTTMDHADRSQLDMSFGDDEAEEEEEEEEEGEEEEKDEDSVEKINKSIHDMSIAPADTDSDSGSGSEADNEDDEEEEEDIFSGTPTAFISSTNSTSALLSSTLISTEPIEVEVFDQNERDLLGDDFINERRSLAVPPPPPSSSQLRKSVRKSIIILSSGEEEEEEEEVVVFKRNKNKTGVKKMILSSSSSSESLDIIEAPSTKAKVKEEEEEEKKPSSFSILPPTKVKDEREEEKKPSFFAVHPLEIIESGYNNNNFNDDVMIISPNSKPKPMSPTGPIIQPKLPSKAKLNIAKIAAAAKPKKPMPIMNYNKLAKSTRHADRAEKEHVRRLAAKARAFKKAFDPDDPATGRILDFDLKTGKVLVRISDALGKHLKPHQVEGVRFMFDAVIESVDRLRQEEAEEEDEDGEGGGSGCILAHSMGLGKTLQVVTFLHAVLTSGHIQASLDKMKVLIVVPYNVIENWAQEFDKWIDRCGLKDDWPLNLFEMRLEKTVKKRVDLLRSWYKRGGILLVTNTLFARLIASLADMADRGAAKAFRSYLLSPGPDLVIIDEGHLLKNEGSQLNQALQLVETRRRVVLTGTPLQNNLAEYYTMVDYVKPRLLGTRQEFKNRFQAPIENGQNRDSAPSEVVHMKKRIHVLYQLLRSVIHRCDYQVLVPYLPPKVEVVLSVALTAKQIEMYRHYLDFYADKPDGTQASRKNLFRDKNLLAHIWTHPVLIHDYRLESEGKETFVNQIGDWYLRYLSPEEDGHRLELSGKLTLLFAIIEGAGRLGEKVVIFSQSLLVLNLIERLLGVRSKQAAAEGLSGGGRWRRNLDYFRIDGGVDSSERSELIDRFNDPLEDRARLMLVSTRAGGVGINLIGANRAVIFDASFNPANDLQAIFRIYRLGQTRPVFVYRMVAAGTMEEKIYKKQIVKQSLSRRVIDEQQVVRHYRKVEVEELYTLNADYDDDPVVGISATDHLLNDILFEHKARGLVLSWHEHDSLLESSPEEEGLTPEEQRAAWEEFERAKREGGGKAGGRGAAAAAFNGGGGEVELLDQSSTLDSSAANAAIDLEDEEEMEEEEDDDSFRVVAPNADNGSQRCNI